MIFTGEDAVKLIKQVLLALNYMHQKGVIHRDLKLDNIMIDIVQVPGGDEEIVCKLVDFGLASVTEPEKKATTQLGTPAFMAPEIVKLENYNEKVDTWSIGVLLYYIMTQKLPFGDSKSKKETIKCVINE